MTGREDELLAEIDRLREVITAIGKVTATNAALVDFSVLPDGGVRLVICRPVSKPDELAFGTAVARELSVVMLDVLRNRPAILRDLADQFEKAALKPIGSRAPEDNR